MAQNIEVTGAREHNLKNINITIPRNKLTVVTGLSGSGKSSLVFDTIYAEGQRRYVESLSSYARQFLELMSKPDVDNIEGLSPAIAIDQKTASRNPRSTVGTVTDIYDYLRLLYAKIGDAHCPKCKSPVEKQTVQEIVDHIIQMSEGKKIMILSPVIRDKKGEHLRVFDDIKREGFVRMRVDGEIKTIADPIKLEKTKKHSIEIIVDRLVVTKDLGENDKNRVTESVEIALKWGDGMVMILDVESNKHKTFSEHFSCPNHGSIEMTELSPRSFSFNSPHGACPECHGLGIKKEIEEKLVIPNHRLTLAEGAIIPWSTTSNRFGWYIKVLEQVSKKYKFSMNDPYSKLSENAKKIVLLGTGDQKYTINMTEGKFKGEYSTSFEGVIPNLYRKYKETESSHVQKEITKYMRDHTCDICEGKRLKPEILSVTIKNQSIIDTSELSIEKCLSFFTNIELSDYKAKIAQLILKEITNRLSFLQNVGLNYLTLSRSANTLSGGEAQRIRLATQIGSQLQGVLYVLDEPSIGLHQKDNDRLILTLKHLRDIENTVIVVEHDEDTMKEADFLVDIGPGAGAHGGEVIAIGTPKEVMNNPNSITGEYLKGTKEIPFPNEYRKGNGKEIEIIGAEENNLKNVSVTIPLGKFVGITGVSGSGKSSLINRILVPHLSRKLNNAYTAVAGKFKEIKGVEHLDKIISIDQKAIGRTPRSNPATYTGVWTDIRNIFAKMPEAKIRGYSAGRFSFNVKGGRCEDCKGDGLKRIEMHFLPDIFVPCETCKGSRYNREALEIKYRGRNIAEVLDLTISEATELFNAIPRIKNKLSYLEKVGLGYIKLGQSATTLSGGEAQRVKLATELSRKSTGKTLYVLDEPTTGLHFDDVKKLLDVLHQLVEKGNSIITIEHNLDVIKSVDHIIDIGPEGGEYGGTILATGTPKEVSKSKKSYTGKYLKRMFDAKANK